MVVITPRRLQEKRTREVRMLTDQGMCTGPLKGKCGRQAPRMSNTLASLWPQPTAVRQRPRAPSGRKWVSTQREPCKPRGSVWHRKEVPVLTARLSRRVTVFSMFTSFQHSSLAPTCVCIDDNRSTWNYQLCCFTSISSTDSIPLWLHAERRKDNPVRSTLWRVRMT